jgi:IS4 transposase
MARALMEKAFASDLLDQVFRENAQRQREGDLLFSNVVDVMSLAVLKIQPSVSAAYEQKKHEVGVAIESVYNKLKGIELEVSRAMLHDSAVQLTGILEAVGAQPRVTQAGYRTMIVDGKHLDRTERRLKPLRELNAAPLPGTVLAVLDADRRLVCDVIPCEDGHAQERSLLDQVLETVRQGDLWIADRNFCTVGFLAGIAARGAHFVIRRHGNLPLELEGRKRRVGKTEKGVVYEQTGCVGKQAKLKVRVVTTRLKEPTRDDDLEVVIISNLPQKVSGRRISELYRRRWTIETAFGEVAASLHGEIDSFAYPKAALFGYCLALVAYNILSVLKATIAAAQDRDYDDLSTYYLANEISVMYAGMMIVLPPDFWRRRYRDMTISQLAAELLGLASGIPPHRFQKNRRGPKRPPPDVGPKTNRNHVSTKRILDEYYQKC